MFRFENGGKGFPNTMVRVRARAKEHDGENDD